MEMTIVIPSRGLAALLTACLRLLHVALAEAGISDHRIVVVDNATPHPFASDRFGPQVEILRFDVPQSFSHACNAGVRRGAAQGCRHVFLLNNDVLLHPRAIAEMLAAKQAAKAAVSGARLVFPDDTIQHCGVRIGGPRPIPYHEHIHTPTPLVSRRLRTYQAVTGAAMIIDHALYDELGGLDECYPFAYEDVDFCLRARQKGHRITCAQAVDSVHFASMTPGRFRHEDESRAIFEARWAGRCTSDTEEGLYKC
ncbi:glycosyltransferase family 2 protein [Pseudohoeflea coraliihabitans]|uniref:Glycosyltransferase family 2 protein n=1 Tax=Pseudohoeflea coraliihabitans TaxID=2860393 RepID=A0ABS6WR47_9HYPH|nr:glycosyltransferase family 2 protein [Pseudohoeflea sp. DP4N28-3]MBW3097514.1 glycosyltransferase family 2 protein [Pseudohoeflea sp. DP4N28-3]